MRASASPVAEDSACPPPPSSVPCRISDAAALVSSWFCFSRNSICPTASRERCASLRTSLATTPKPLPCSPARAASIAVFTASMLVSFDTSWMSRSICDTTSLGGLQPRHHLLPSAAPPRRSPRSSARRAPPPRRPPAPPARCFAAASAVFSARWRLRQASAHLLHRSASCWSCSRLLPRGLRQDVRRAPDAVRVRHRGHRHVREALHHLPHARHHGVEGLAPAGPPRPRSAPAP